jgi:hypothetical protein
MKSSFICPTCGETHEGSPTDYAWQLPDCVWAIPEPERSSKSRFTADLCQLGSQFFIRCVLELPFIERAGYYGWGIWVEVPEATFHRYLELYEQDGSDEPPVAAAMANAIPGYPSTSGLPVTVQFRDPASRPAVHVSSSISHPLAAEQSSGLSMSRYHEILAVTGAVGEH